MGVLDAVLEVFDGVGSWLGDAMSAVIPVFYDATGTGLTFIGVLAVASLGISVAFLILNVIKSYLTFQ